MEILRIENVTKTYGEKDTAVHAWIGFPSL